MLNIVSSELVVPNEETPKNPLWLSNLDLAARRGYTAMVYFYRPNDTGTVHDFFSVKTLKSSLAKALVPFYPLAGRLSVNQDGRLEVNCTGEGALFVVAQSDKTLDDFDDFAPSTEMRNYFVPQSEQSEAHRLLLMLQVTFFKCGGVALGTAMHHNLVDARSAFHFMDTWSSIARGDLASIIPPFFDQNLLSARPDRKILFDHLEYKSNIKSTVPSSFPTSYESSVIRISKKQIDALKLSCGDTFGVRVSTFRAITALLWRCVCKARKLDTNSESRLYTMIDVRSRMRPPLPLTYFGNAVIRTSISAAVGDVISNPLSQVAQRLNGATKQGDDFTRSLIDYLEIADMGYLPRSGLSKYDLRVISWIGMPMHNANFGWGESIFSGPALMYYRGYVCLMNSPGKDAGVSVVVALEPETLPLLKELFIQELASATLPV